MGHWQWMIVGGIVLMIAALRMRPKDCPWEWSPLWGLAGNSSTLGKAVGVLGVVLVLLGAHTYLQAGSYKKDVCAVNRGKIECAKDTFALANNLKSGTVLTPAQVEQLGAFCTGGWQALRCDKGGTYQVGKIGEPCRCSVHGQTSP